MAIYEGISDNKDFAREILNAANRAVVEAVSVSDGYLLVGQLEGIAALARILLQRLEDGEA